MDEIFDLIKQELDHQNAKWGADRILHPYLWNTIIQEEVGEAARASLENNPDQYIEELVDVAASAISAIRSAMLSRQVG